jgi:hypothetical protein
VMKINKNGIKKEQMIVRCISDFRELVRQLEILYPRLELSFPSINNIDVQNFEIMMNKRTELQYFFDRVISIPYIPSSLPFEKFFDPFDEVNLIFVLFFIFLYIFF